jgi:hypothetical protein
MFIEEKKSFDQVPNNSILVLNPYKYAGTWVFDDSSTGLVREAFVSGVPEILEKMLELQKIPLEVAEKGFLLTFSSKPFPGFLIEAKHESTEFEGNWYVTNEGLRGWLCPALFKYFSVAPQKLYARVDFV